MTITVRHYVDNAPQVKLVGAINSTATSCVVTSTAGLPAVLPWSATLDIGTASAEVVLVTAATGTTLTITRNTDSQGAYSHADGGTLDHTSVAQDYIEANTHITTSTGVHGLAGSVVGTTDTQTLSGKTLAHPVVTGGGSWAGGLTVDSVTVSGGLTPPSYTNQAAVTAAIGSPGPGAEVWLTAPTGGGAPGLYVYDGSSWKSVAVAATRFTARAQYHQAASQSLTTATDNILTGWVVDTDTITGFSTSSGFLACPAGMAGSFECSALLTVANGPATYFNATMFKNSVRAFAVRQAADPSGITSLVLPPLEVTLAAGDTISVGIYPNGSGSATQVGFGTFLRLKRLEA